jgi:hypothetical protein
LGAHINPYQVAGGGGCGGGGGAGRKRHTLAGLTTIGPLTRRRRSLFAVRNSFRLLLAFLSVLGCGAPLAVGSGGGQQTNSKARKLIAVVLHSTLDLGIQLTII